jgi:hypothetical protein
LSDEEMRQRYQAGLQRRTERHPAVPLGQLEALVAHRLPEADAVALLDRVMADEGLRSEYELLRSIGAARHASPRPWVRPAVLALAAGLAAVVAIASARGGRQEPAGTVRGNERGALLASPASGAVVSLPATLAWYSVPGARSYRVEVLDADGAVLLAREGTDTTLALESGRVPSGPAQWWVEVRFTTGADRSELRSVTFAVP